MWLGIPIPNGDYQANVVRDTIDANPFLVQSVSNGLPAGVIPPWTNGLPAGIIPPWTNGLPADSNG